jgi:CheY-like chemotaxis protein
VREAVDGALLLVGPRLRQTGVRIVRHEADEEALVMAERFRLEQVLVNLLQNALEALEGTTDPEIAIQVSARRSQIRIAIADNGPGLAPRRPRRCSRRSPPPSPGGWAWAWSSAATSSPSSAASWPWIRPRPGRGSSFHCPRRVRCRFPSTRSPSSTTTTPCAAPMSRPCNWPAWRCWSSPRPSRPGRLARGFAGVVISDIRMPNMDGRQLFRRLKEQDPDLPVILITGHADVAEAVEAMHDGVYDFLPKPYAPERLVSSVRRALEKRRLVLENRYLRPRPRRPSPIGR